MEMEETKIGRLPHKIEKLIGAASAPGVEFLRSEVFSGDHGLSVIEHAPFGVICAITPVTHSLPTIACNAICMISAGNTLVVNPHPSGRRVAAEGVRRFNEAIYRDLGIDNLLCLITEPTIETADALFKHPDINLICVTGGPAVARAAMQQPKRPSSPAPVTRPWSSTRRPTSIGPPDASSWAGPTITICCALREASLRRRFDLRPVAVRHGAGRRGAAQCGRDRRPDQGSHHHGR